jgi:hypothetical protein
VGATIHGGRRRGACVPPTARHRTGLVAERWDSHPRTPACKALRGVRASPQTMVRVQVGRGATTWTYGMVVGEPSGLVPLLAPSNVGRTDLLIRRLVRVVRRRPVEVVAQVERPGEFATSRWGPTSWVNGGYTTCPGIVSLGTAAAAKTVGADLRPPVPRPASTDRLRPRRVARLWPGHCASSDCGLSERASGRTGQSGRLCDGKREERAVVHG